MRFLSNPIFLHRIFQRSVHLDFSPNWKLSKKLWDRYRKLPVANCKVQVTYIWIDGTGKNLRSKTRTMDYVPTSPKDCPIWDFDGSATFLAEPKNSDLLLCPIAIYNDPIAQSSRNKIVLCETCTEDGKPTKSNHRQKCIETLACACDKEPLFGFEQQFVLKDVTGRPFGWPVAMGEPSPLGSYYCSLGAHRAFGREILECVYRCCLFCGIEICGLNAEAMPSQWELQIGPCDGLKAADDLWFTRYILQRVAEDFGVYICQKPEEFPNWKKNYCHTHFSTKEMRQDGGYKYIEEALQKLASKHQEHLSAYDSPGCLPQFEYGVADRTGCARISRKVAGEKKGHFEDRRVPAHADPYKVVSAMINTICLNC